MRTDVLIDWLARSAGPAPRAVVARRMLPAAGAGWLLSTMLSLGLFGLVPGEVFTTPVPWIKLAYTGGLAQAAGWLVARLARPLARLAKPAMALAGFACVMAVLGLLGLATLPAAARAPSLHGPSWMSCPWNVLGLSLPALAGALWALRGLAPTRPRLAGLAAGLLSGSLGAAGYALSCPESSPAFVAVWYTLGVVLTGGLGAWIGPWALRW